MALQNTHYGYQTLQELLSGCRRIFFIGIGGVSMCSLAEMTLEDGCEVCGSDRSESERLERLRELGAEIYIGHDAAHLEGVDAVVYTVAIDENNPEYRAATERNLPRISRSDYLGYLMMRFRHRIGIAGTNGKSTTTALCAHFLEKAVHPTVLCGAEAETLGNSSCRLGKDREVMVFEACEYMDSFLDFNPTLAVLLNVSLDHVDYFESLEQMESSFLKFAGRTGEAGMVLYNADDPELCRAMADYRGKTLTYGFQNEADFTAENVIVVGGKRQFSFCYRGEELCRLKPQLIGEYQIYNTLAAAAAAYLSGVEPQDLAERITSFVGVHRRMEYVGTLNGADVISDYSHHPVAIEAVLKNLKDLGYERVLCAFQPHTFSRTKGLLAEFAEALGGADRVYLADIYAAREQNESGISSGDLAELIGEKASYCGDFATLACALKREVRQGDLLLVMGAGDVEQVFPLIGLS